MSSIAVDSEPRDVMRLGLGNSEARNDNTVHHPVQAIQQHFYHNQQQQQEQQAARMYGTTVPLKNRLELQMLSQVGRLPGVTSFGHKSSNFGLEILLGVDEDIDQHDYMNLSQNQPESLQQLDVHDRMELALGDKPMKNFS